MPRIGTLPLTVRAACGPPSRGLATPARVAVPVVLQAFRTALPAFTSVKSVVFAVVIGLVSVSDRASGGVYEDKGIPALSEWFTAALAISWRMETRLIPDEQPLRQGAWD